MSIQLTPVEDAPTSVSVVPLPLSVATEPPPPPQGALSALPDFCGSRRGSLEVPQKAISHSGLSAPVTSFGPEQGEEDDVAISRSISMQEKKKVSMVADLNTSPWGNSEGSMPLCALQSSKSAGADSIFPDLNKASGKVAQALTNFGLGEGQTKKTLKKSMTGIFTNNGWNTKVTDNRRPSNEIVGNVLDEITTLHSPKRPKSVQESKQEEGEDKPEANPEPDPATKAINFTIFSEEGNPSPRIPTIRFLSPFGVWMDRVRIILGVWAITYTPLALAFEELEGEHWALKVVDVACDLIFLMGFLLALVTTVGSVSAGREYLSPKIILLKRLHSKAWWMDGISCLPFIICLCAGEVPQPVSTFYRGISWLKLLRIHWVIGMPASHFETRFMSSVQVFRMFLWICLSMHLMACLWYVIVLDNGTLERHMEDMSRRTMASDYLMAFKYGSYMVTGKPVMAYSDGELLMIAISSPLGGILFAFIYGNTTMLVTRMSIHMSKHHKHIALIRSTMRTLDIPVELRQRITKYHHFLAVHHNVNSYALLMQGLSVNLFIELKAHLFKKLFSEGPFFQGAPGGFLRSLVQVMVEVTYCPGDVIIRYGDLGDQMYFVVKGRLDVLSPQNLVIGKIQENMYFGEIALLISTPRLVSIRAATYCLLAMISRDRFIPILEAYPEQRQRMLESMKGYKNIKAIQEAMNMEGDNDAADGSEEEKALDDAKDEESEEVDGYTTEATEKDDATDVESRISPYTSEQQIQSVPEDSKELDLQNGSPTDSIDKEQLKLERKLMPLTESTTSSSHVKDTSTKPRISGTSNASEQFEDAEDRVEEMEDPGWNKRSTWDSEAERNNHGVGGVMKVSSLFNKRRLSDLKGVSSTLFGGQNSRRKSKVNLKRGASICEKSELTSDELTAAISTGINMQQTLSEAPTDGVGRNLAPTLSLGQGRRISNAMPSAMPSAQPSRRESFVNTLDYGAADKKSHSLKHLDLPARNVLTRHSADSIAPSIQASRCVSPNPLGLDHFNRSSHGTSAFDEQAHGPNHFAHGTLLEQTPGLPGHGHSLAHGMVLEPPTFQQNCGTHHDSMKWSATGDILLERIEEMSQTFCKKLEDVEGRIVRRVEERFDPPLKELMQRVQTLQRTIDEVHFNTDLIQNFSTSSSTTIAESRRKSPQSPRDREEEV